MTESIKIVALNSQFVMWEAKPVADMRARTRKLFLFYTEKSIMQISFAFFLKKRKRVRLSIRKSHSLWKIHINEDGKLVCYYGVGEGSGVEDDSGVGVGSGVGDGSGLEDGPGAVDDSGVGAGAPGGHRTNLVLSVPPFSSPLKKMIRLASKLRNLMWFRISVSRLATSLALP